MLYYKIGDPVLESDFSIAKNSYTGTDASGKNESPIIINGQNSASYVLQNLLEEQKYSFILTAFRNYEESSPTDPIVLEAISRAIPPTLMQIEEVK